MNRLSKKNGWFASAYSLLDIIKKKIKLRLLVLGTEQYLNENGYLIN